MYHLNTSSLPSCLDQDFSRYCFFTKSNQKNRFKDAGQVALSLYLRWRVWLDKSPLSDLLHGLTCSPMKVRFAAYCIMKPKVWDTIKIQQLLSHVDFCSTHLFSHHDAHHCGRVLSSPQTCVCDLHLHGNFLDEHLYYSIVMIRTMYVKEILTIKDIY